jgi:WD40 repeat protein
MNKQNISTNNSITKLITLKHEGSVFSVSWHPHSLMLVTASGDGNTVIWNSRNGKRFATFSLEKGFYQGLWSPDGSRLATIDRGHKWSGPFWKRKIMYSIHIWNVEDKKEEIILLHDSFINSIAWHPDSNRIATGTYDAMAYIWDANTGHKTAALQHRGDVERVSWKPNGSELATSSWKNTTRIWNGKNGAEVFCIEHDNTEATGKWSAAAWSHSGKELATVFNEDVIIIWDTEEWDKIQHLEDEHRISFLMWSPEDNWLLSGVHYTPDTIHPKWHNTECYLSIWKPDIGDHIALWNHSGRMVTAKWHPDGRLVAVGLHDGTIYILDSAGNELSSINHNGKILSIDWNHDGSKLATGSDDGTVIIWNVPNPKSF